jgi:hypothetical protein
MTEDDTYRILKRSTYETLFEDLCVRLYSPDELYKIFEAHGWTDNEYLKEHCRRLKKKNEKSN